MLNQHTVNVLLEQAGYVKGMTGWENRKRKILLPFDAVRAPVDDKMEFVEWIGINAWRKTSFCDSWYDKYNNTCKNIDELYKLFKFYKESKNNTNETDTTTRKP